MTRFPLLAALVFLSACATAPAATTPTVNAPTGATATRPPLLSYLETAGRADAAALQEIERNFGAPDIRRQDGAGATLTYRLNSCALMLLFTADARNEMRLAEAHAGPRRANEAAPTLEQCAREVGERRAQR